MKTVKKYTSNKMKLLEDNAKYFMGEFQPLLEENYQLKDTIINFNEILKCKKNNSVENILQTIITS